MSATSFRSTGTAGYAELLLGSDEALGTRGRIGGGVTHDYVCHGVTTLFAALDIATDEVPAQCKR